ELLVAPLQLAGGLVQLLVRAIQAALALEGADDSLDLVLLLPLREDLPDGLALLRGELLLVGVQDDGAKAPRGLGHLVPQAVQHLLEVTARDADLVAERLPQRRGTRSPTDEDDEPERQHAPGVRGAPASETVEERGHG